MVADVKAEQRMRANSGSSENLASLWMFVTCLKAPYISADATAESLLEC